LVGRAAGARVDVLCVEVLPNVSESLARFELDLGALVAADRRARDRGLAIVGVWHSHVDAPAIPSRADVEGAWDGLVQVILSLRGGELAELRAWRVDRDRARELPLWSAPSTQPISARSASASAR
jgi:proteasome lid subunit RPN8/RPN11